MKVSGSESPYRCLTGWGTVTGYWLRSNVHTPTGLGCEDKFEGMTLRVSGVNIHLCGVRPIVLLPVTTKTISSSAPWDLVP